MRVGRVIIASGDDLQKMYDAAIGILETVGMRVMHRTVLDRLESYGAKVSHADGIVRMPSKVVQKAVAAIKKASSCNLLPRDGMFAKRFEVSLGDGCLFFYDFERKTRRKATKEDFVNTVKFADEVPEVTGFCAPVEIGSVSVEMMALEMQALCYLNSGKPSDVENNIPEQVKYLAELHRVVSHYRETPGSLGNAQTATSPLIFGDRAGDLYIEGGKYGFQSGVCTMPVAGINAPVTIEGCAVQAAAEILGMWTCLMATDENRRVSTLVLTGTTDMRTGKVCWSSPAAIKQNCLVSTMLNDVVGVPVSWDWTWYTDALQPGYQCAIDRVMKMLAMTPQSGSIGFHLGDLDGASVFSLEQAVLDLDICRAVWQIFKPAQFDDEMMAIEEIQRIGLNHGKTHLDSEFTIKHFRDALWMPDLIPHVYWKEGLEGVSEADVIKKAHERWKSIVSHHEPYRPPDGMVREIEQVLSKAREELL